MKILVGLSGGVDSAVALYLLQKAGHEVEAAFMRNWDSALNDDVFGNPHVDSPTCPQEQDYLDALAVANALKVKLHRVDYVKDYWEKVFVPFIEEYRAGRTPNPDVFCNKHIKFKLFLDYALAQGFEAIATGHYAGKRELNGVTLICKAHDLNKDQSYFLCQLDHKQIQKATFPLNDLDKEEVRNIAAALNLEVAKKKDSTGICFIGERMFDQFLKNYIPLQEGPIIDLDTNQQVGTHKGAQYYTIGQRKGLGIGGLHGREGALFFVVDKDISKNIVYVSSQISNLDGKEVKVINPHLLTTIEDGGLYQAKFRYRQKDIDVRVYLEKDCLRIESLTPVRALTPGQLAVIYRDDCIVASGIIDQVVRWKKS